jgi:hypothetical protein
MGPGRVHPALGLTPDRPAFPGREQPHSRLPGVDGPDHGFGSARSRASRSGVTSDSTGPGGCLTGSGTDSRGTLRGGWIPPVLGRSSDGPGAPRARGFVRAQPRRHDRVPAGRFHYDLPDGGYEPDHGSVHLGRPREQFQLTLGRIVPRDTSDRDCTAELPRPVPESLFDRLPGHDSSSTRTQVARGSSPRGGGELRASCDEAGAKARVLAGACGTLRFRHATRGHEPPIRVPANPAPRSPRSTRGRNERAVQTPVATPRRRPRPGSGRRGSSAVRAGARPRRAGTWPASRRPRAAPSRSSGARDSAAALC